MPNVNIVNDAQIADAINRVRARAVRHAPEGINFDIEAARQVWMEQVANAAEPGRIVGDNPAAEMVWQAVRPARLADVAQQLGDMPALRVDDPVNPLGVNHKYGPELWTQLLDGVKEIFNPEWCIVAGGAVRDHLLKLPPKDVDIFVRKPKVLDKDVGNLVDQANCLGWQNIHIVGNPGQYGQKKVEKVVLAGDTLGHRVEMILVKEETPEALLDSFDFEICKCWFDGEIHTTAKANVDIVKKQFTPTKEIDEAAKLRFDRINARHGNIFKLNVNGEPWYKKFAGKEKIK
jgi:hypothetical protein